MLWESMINKEELEAQLNTISGIITDLVVRVSSMEKILMNKGVFTEDELKDQFKVAVEAFKDAIQKSLELNK